MGKRGEVRHLLTFLSVSKEEGTFIPLFTEVRNSILGGTHSALHSMTVFAPFCKRRMTN